MVEQSSVLVALGKGVEVWREEADILALEVALQLWSSCCFSVLLRGCSAVYRETGEGMFWGARELVGGASRRERRST